MITYSVIQKSQLERGHRLDAEYYQPEYFIDYSKGDWKPISSFLEICQYGISQAMNEEAIGYPIFRMHDIKNAFLMDDEIKYVDIPKNIFNQFKLEKNDVLFNRVNSEDFVGRTGIFKLDGDFVFASYLIRLRVKMDSSIFADYLNIFLNSSFGIKQIRKFRRRAVNQANVNAEELKQIRIPVLPQKFQKEIEQISNNSWKNYELSKSLYSKAEDLLLEELGLKNFKPEEELFYIINLSNVKSAHRVDAEYFQPKYEKIIEKIKEQNVKSLGNLFSLRKGFEPGSDEYQNEGKLFIRVSNISKQGLIDKDQKYLSDELYRNLKTDFEPKAGEILLTKDATPGIAYALEESIDGITAGGILRLILKQAIEPEYLALCINSIIGQMQIARDSGGSVIAHWKPEEIKKLQVPILTKSNQQKIADMVHQSHQARKKAKELLEKAKREVEEFIEKAHNESRRN
jgi:type I restriction enzyme S subunit